jgi:anti-sigma B factor antagonist
MSHLKLNPRLENDDILVLELRVEKLTASNAHAFLQAVKVLMPHQRKVVLDLAGVQFIDSLGLGALLSCRQYLNDVQGHLHLCELSHTVSKLLELMRLERTFQIHGTCAEAVQSFSVLQS